MIVCIGWVLLLGLLGGGQGQKIALEVEEPGASISLRTEEDQVLLLTAVDAEPASSGDGDARLRLSGSPSSAWLSHPQPGLLVDGDLIVNGVVQSPTIDALIEARENAERERDSLKQRVDVLEASHAFPTSLSTLSSRPADNSARLADAPDDYVAEGGRIYFVGSEYEAFKVESTSNRLRGTLGVWSVDSEPVQHAGRAFFAGSDDQRGSELWSWSASHGASLVADIAPGPDSSSPQHLTPTPVGLFFTASAPSFGRELWLHTDDGETVLAADIVSGSFGSDPQWLAPMPASGQLFFVATDSSSGRSVWAYNWTTGKYALTVGGSVLSTPANLVTIGHKLFFSATDGSRGNELHHYDASSGMLSPFKGEIRVDDVVWCVLRSTASPHAADLRAGMPSSDPGNLTVVGDMLYFSAVVDSRGRELVGYNVTSGVDPIVWDIDGSGAGSSDPSKVVVANGRVFVVATSASGDRVVFSATADLRSDRQEHVVGPADRNPRSLMVCGDFIVHTVERLGATQVVVRKAAQMNSTLAPTQLLFNGDSKPSSVQVINEMVWFEATVTAGSRAFYSCGCECSSPMPRGPVYSTSGVHGSIWDGTNTDPSFYGKDAVGPRWLMWWSPSEGLRTAHRQAELAGVDMVLEEITATDGIIYLLTQDLSGATSSQTKLYSYDTSNHSRGVVAVPDNEAFPIISHIFGFDGWCYYQRFVSSTRELWRARWDQAAHEAFPSSSLLDPVPAAVHDGELYIHALLSSNSARRSWMRISHAAVGNSRTLKNDTTCCSFVDVPQHNVGMNVLSTPRGMLFAGDWTSLGPEPSVYDPVNGTRLLEDIRSTGGSGPSVFVPFGSGGEHVLFFAEDGIEGSEPWQLLPSGAVRRLPELRPGEDDASVTTGARVGERAAVLAARAGSPLGRWRVWEFDALASGPRPAASEGLLRPGVVDVLRLWQLNATHAVVLVAPEDEASAVSIELLVDPSAAAPTQPSSSPSSGSGDALPPQGATF